MLYRSDDATTNGANKVYIKNLSTKYLKNPSRITVGGENVIAKNIKQEVIELKSDEKLLELKICKNASSL